MRIVLDTNVIVSGLLSPERAPAQILRFVLSGRVKICHDPRILLEYENVLLRPKFRFSKPLVAELVGFFKDFGESVVAMPLNVDLPDPSDAPFLEVALSGKAEYLVTGNLKHFPRAHTKEVAILSPADFLRKVD